MNECHLNHFHSSVVISLSDAIFEKRKRDPAGRGVSTEATEPMATTLTVLRMLIVGLVAMGLGGLIIIVKVPKA